jgi:hypothetical protein
MLSVRCLRSVTSLTKARSLRSRNFDALENVAAMLGELLHASADGAQLLSVFAVDDLETWHRWPTLFGVVGDRDKGYRPPSSCGNQNVEGER